MKFDNADDLNFLTVKYVAEKLDRSVQSVYNLIHDDEIPHVQLPGGGYRILERDFLDWIQDNRE